MDGSAKQNEDERYESGKVINLSFIPQNIDSKIYAHVL